jgi:hypothetical protein
VHGGVATLPPHPILDAPREAIEAAASAPGVVVPDVVLTPTWPCTTCGDLVAMERDTCPACGSGFLAAAAGEPVIQVPGIGPVGTPTTSAKVALMVGGTLLLMVVLLGIFFLLGALI